VNNSPVFFLNAAAVFLAGSLQKTPQAGRFEINERVVNYGTNDSLNRVRTIFLKTFLKRIFL
jgi:hypothetical protein